MLAILEGPLRRPIHVVLPTLVGLAAGLASDRVLPRPYRASAAVRADWHEPRDAGSARGPVDEDHRRLAYVRLHVLGRDAIERVLREASPYPPGERPRSEQAQAMLEAASVRPGEDGSYLVEYVHRDPAKAALVANRLAGLLVERSESEGVSSPESDPERLSARLVEARRSIEEKEAALRRLQEEAATRSGRPAETTPPRSGNAGARREVADGLAEARARRDRLREAIAAAEEPADDAGAPPPELARLRAERQELSKRYTDVHPDMQALDRRIRELEAALPAAPERAPAADASSLRAELSAVDAEIEALEKKAAKGMPRAAPAGEALATMTQELLREQEAYLALLEQWRAAETALRLGRGGRSARFELLRAAAVPEKPGGPSRDLLAAIGLCVGLVAGFGGAFVAERRDRRVKGPEDLESVLPVSVLATIPRVRRSWFRRH